MKCKLSIYLIIIIFVLLFQSTLYAQYSNNKMLLKHKILDTLKATSTSVSLKVLWLKDTLEVRSSLGIDIAIDSIVGNIIKNRKDPEYKPSEKKIVNMKKFIATSFQNCYSYALERYFRDNARFRQELFCNTVWLQNGMEKILNNSFRRVTRFKTKPRRLMMRFIPDKVILAFRDKNGSLLHTLYHNQGIFYSKNGALKAKEYRDIKQILRGSYRDTEVIEIYKLDLAINKKYTSK